jgi:pSer/pThr/pTyr-binding forkhead associated (FHA) protein
MAKLIISRDGVVTDTRFIDKPVLRIGSAADNDVRLTSVGISRHHARIASVVNDDILEDLASSNGTRVNGEATRQRVLQNDDIIEIADYQIRYRNHKAVDGPSFDQTMVIQTPGIERDTMMAREAVAHSKRRQRGAYANRRIAALRDLNAPGNNTIELSQLLRGLGEPSSGLAVINARPHGYFIAHVTGPKPARVNGQTLGSEARALLNDDVIEVGSERFQFVSK